MSLRKAYSRSSKGFTLIEVIVAVSIVVILASFAMPKVTGYIGKAKQVKLNNIAKQIHTAVMWSYGEQGNTINTTNISSIITDTLSGITVNLVTSSNNVVTVLFTNDSIQHTATINVSDNSYTVT
ncbi:prepilin-type N-terminal cleavage/methylation domain-containing protein [Clostridium swellfunianum]|uniref:prepilin-type N-terminal cleavage/methylation domain-containing protein n=1 Tax=Clostridium swellfunianum TaxID=1367462 RepID=UPI00202F00E2|nr:prepilin-type N-terminal cleavage/methylation domain-containing protein [Clostridium swellfunianum]MCM0650389.1 prepilin-type N-terminal cleavage/methylation domain-containing protein [Clostridium swellfunianum]